MEAASFTAYCKDSRPPSSDLHALISIAECIIEYLRIGCEQLSEDQLGEVSANGSAYQAHVHSHIKQIMLRAGVQSRQASMSHNSSIFEGVLKRIPRYHALLKASADTPCKGSSKRQDGRAAVTSAFAKELHYTSKYREGHFRAAVFTGQPLWHHNAAHGPTAPLALVLFPPNHAESRVTHVFLPTGAGARIPAADASWQPAGLSGPAGCSFSTCDGLRPAQQLILSTLGLPSTDATASPLTTTEEPLVHMQEFRVTVLRRRGGGTGGASSAGGGTLAAFSVGSVPSVFPSQGGAGGQAPVRRRLSPVPDERGSPASPAASTAHVPAAVATHSPQPSSRRGSRGGSSANHSSSSSPKRVRVGKKHKQRKAPDASAASGGGGWHLGDTVAFAAGDSVPWSHRQHVPSTAHATDPMRVSQMASPVKGAVRAGLEAAALVRTLNIPGVTAPRRESPPAQGLPSPGRSGSARALGEVIAATWSSLEGHTYAGETPLTPSADIPSSSPRQEQAQPPFHGYGSSGGHSPAPGSSVMDELFPSDSSARGSTAQSQQKRHSHSSQPQANTSQGGQLLSFSPPRPSSPAEGKASSPRDGIKAGSGSPPARAAFGPPVWYNEHSPAHSDSKAAGGAGGDVAFNPPESPPRNAEQRSRYKRYAALRAQKAQEDAQRKAAWAARKRGEGGAHEAQEEASDSGESPHTPPAAIGGRSAGAVSPTADLDLDEFSAADGGGGGRGASRGRGGIARGVSPLQAHGASAIGGDFSRSMSRGGASNAPRLRNALKFVCLAGPNRSEDLREALDAMRAVERAPEGAETNFVVLFRTPAQLLYKALYAFHVPSGALRRIHGRGPAQLPPGPQRDKRIKGFYKFSTGARQFQVVPTRAMTVSTDAIALSLAPAKQPPAHTD